MRARNIKPGFFKDEDLAECSIPARLLAIGLWSMADREGRMEDRPKRIKMEVFPADSIDVEELLQELAAYKHIVRYVIEGVSYIFIPGFSTHQSPHHTEKKSLLPSPFQEDNGKKASSRKKKSVTLPPDSLIPDSLIPDSLIPSADAETAGAKKAPRQKKSRKKKIYYCFDEMTFKNITEKHKEALKKKYAPRVFGSMPTPKTKKATTNDF